MSRLPRVTGEELIRALERMGFYVHRKKGSHRFLYHREDRSRFAVVAVHRGETVPPGTLKAILRSAGVSAEELQKHL
ncbi:MAG: type II toxin-antitoxin system HicA family toxin [Firmicutes bacterium]|nr:type II toxin-antitoxin system HicA family toxin [Bacillota bacterium]